MPKLQVFRQGGESLFQPLGSLAPDTKAIDDVHIEQTRLGPEMGPRSWRMQSGRANCVLAGAHRIALVDTGHGAQTDHWPDASLATGPFPGGCQAQRGGGLWRAGSWSCALEAPKRGFELRRGGRLPGPIRVAELTSGIFASGASLGVSRQPLVALCSAERARVRLPICDNARTRRSPLPVPTVNVSGVGPQPGRTRHLQFRWMNGGRSFFECGNKVSTLRSG